jgi:glycine/D-amino acid oxidase-like deaminating enzyme
LGAATADALAARGHRVTVLDAGELPDERASSADISKVIRAGYGAQTERYGPLVLDAWRAWRALDADAGERLLHPTGVLLLTSAEDPRGFARASLDGLRALGARAEELSADEGARRWPGFDWTDLAGAVWEPDAGWLAATEAVRALARRAAAHGATLRPRHAVDHLEPLPDRVRLRGAWGALDVDHAVLAAGPWVRRLWPAAPATPTRQHIALFDAPHARLHDHPVWLHDLAGEGWYGFPPHPSGVVKLGLHRWAGACDPDDPRVPDDAFLAEARAFARRRLPGLPADAALRGRVCLYTNSPTGDLVVHTPPEAPRLTIAGLGSGHGFKLGPAIGALVADALAGHAPPAWLTPTEGERAVW